MVNIELKNTEPLMLEISQLFKLYNSGQTQKALKHAVALTDRFPTVGFIRSILGTLHTSLGDFPSAVFYFKECLKLDPTDADCLNKLGLAQTILGEKFEAHTNYTRAIELKPDFADAYANLAHLAFDSDKQGEAVLSFNRSLLIQPDSCKVYGEFGDLLSLILCQSSALLMYRKATLLKPIFKSFYIGKVSDLSAMGMVKAALPYYNKAKIVNADLSILHYDLGISFNQKGDLKNAVSNFDRAFLLNPTFVEAYNNSGSIYAAAGDTDQAILRFKAALVANPIVPATYNNLGAELLNGETFKEAFFYLKKAIQLEPNSKNAYINYANTLLETKKISLASTLYGRALILNPEDASTKHMLNAVNENTTKTAPSAYIQDLFNQYAAGFDKHLIGKLKYNVPSLLREFYDEIFNDPTSQFRILDLGCGTGLSGQAFKDLSFELTGIDLSENMIAAAKLKNLYDKFILGDICEKLIELKNQNLFFDLFICTDVLIYVGDCDEIFSMVKKLSVSRSRFILSTENKNGEGYSLLKSGRYAHSKDYIIGCAKRHGFNVVDFKEIPIRWTSTGTLYGDIFLLETN